MDSTVIGLSTGVIFPHVIAFSYVKNDFEVRGDKNHVDENVSEHGKSNAWAQYHNSGESDYNNIKYYKILITIFAHRFLSSYKTWQAWNQKFLLVKLTPSGVVSFSKTTRGEDTST